MDYGAWAAQQWDRLEAKLDHCQQELDDTEYELREARSEIARHHVYIKAMEDLLIDVLHHATVTSLLRNDDVWKQRIREVLNSPGRTEGGEPSDSGLTS